MDPGRFDDLAETYEHFRTGYAEDVFDALFEYGLRPGDRVLDLATGTGVVANELSERGCNVTGVDLSKAMLTRARRRVPEAVFRVAAPEALPFASASFDAATCAQSVNWFDSPRALAEIVRVLRPGGIVAVWWKALMRGDGVRLLREETAIDLGLEPATDLLARGFPEFERVRLADRRLRVLPWIVHTTVGDYLAYERSWARARERYGNGLERYLNDLAKRLGPPDSKLSLSYVHALYLGRTPDAGL